MNICEALYDAEKVQREVDRLMAKGMTREQAISRVAQEVIATTEAESQRGVVHGVVQEIDPHG